MPKLTKPDRRIILTSLGIGLLVLALFTFLVPISSKNAFRESQCTSTEPYACGVNCIGYDMDNLPPARYHISLGKLTTYLNLEPIAEPGQCGDAVRAKLYL